MYYRALRKRQFIVPVVKHFTVNDENTICNVFQFHNPKLSQQGCFKTYIHYTRLCTRYSTVKHFTENDENTICIVFQFHNQKLSQEGCFKQHVCNTRLCTGRSTKEGTNSFF